MGASARARPRGQLLAVLVVVAVGVVAALVWSRNDGSADETIRIGGSASDADSDITGNPRVTGRQIPDVELLAVDGTVVRLGDGDGRPMVVNLWYSTCAPCARELRDFAEVHAELSAEVRFVGVDPIDALDVMQRFAVERGVTYELLRDPDYEFTNALDVVAFPITVFVDPDGTIVGESGPLDDDGLRERIEALW